METFKYSKTITGDEIDDIMDSAMRGISYWAGSADVVGDYLGKYASEQISRGGRIKIYDAESEKTYVLTRGKFLKGMGLFTGNTEPTEIDDPAADSIIQLALFGRELYS
jgi:hypothetical protein